MKRFTTNTGAFSRTPCLLLAFLGLALSLSTRPATAAGTWTWSAELIYAEGTPYEKDYYASQTYPTKARAIAAMQALQPYATQVTQEAGISYMSPYSVTYRWVPPVPLATIGPWTFGFGQEPGPYSSQAAAVAAQTTLSCPYYVPYTSCVFSPNGPWYQFSPNQNQPVEPYDQVDAENYTLTVVQSGKTSNYFAVLDQSRNFTCPMYYGLNWGNPTVPPTCTPQTYHGYITGQLLECPSNGSPSIQVGDPCDVSTGDFSQTESDFSSVGLIFQRYYHSAILESSHSLGAGWTHNYAAYLVLSNGYPFGLLRPDGHQDALLSTSTSGVYISASGAAIHVQQSGSQWIASMKDGSSEVYSSTGQLVQKVTPNGLITTLTYNPRNQLSAVTGPFGHTLQFSYNANGQIQQLIDPAGHAIVYAYDGHNNLQSATYQDSKVRTYLYENSAFPNNLTGILDESSSRFLTVAYDPTTGAVTSSQQAGGAQAVSITYSANAAVATNGLGEVDTFTFENSGYAPRVISLSRNNLLQSFTVTRANVDPQQRVTQSVDANNNITNYTYDADHLTSKTDAFGTANVRTTSYQYLATTTALPTLVTDALRKTAYAYFPGTNHVQTRTVTDTTVTPNVSRTWTYSYYSNGQVETVDGPRTDVSDITTYTYYTCTTGTQCGQIDTITNAVGQVTTFNTYNAYGQPLTITDPNGVVTTLTYDSRQRVKSREVGTETTSYIYYPTGQLETVTLPDSSTITYTYDGAHRLTDITDGLGNHTHYTLDAMGNRTAENTYDPSATLRRTHTRVINALNELYQDVNAAGTAAVTTTYTYDNNGNQASSDAPLSRNTANQYDPLNRLKQITDPESGITKFSYDANDQLTSVIDPRSFSTSYTRNGFGDLAKQVSPDTGMTTNTYDSGGNLKTATDARGAIATYSYDALNRVIQLAYTDQTIHYTYDAGANGKGRLTGASDANHSLSWTYDTLGHVTGKGQTVGSVTKAIGYSYFNGDLLTLTTPSGQVITYGYTNHRITSLKVNGTTVLSGVTYDPFGPANAWTWGNAATVSRMYNTDGSPVHIVTDGVTNAYTIDNSSRITGIRDSGLSSNTYTFGYDLLDRVTSGVSSATNRGYTYDANSNRLTTTGTTASTETIATTSNQLDATSGAIARTYGYDAAGNVESYANNVYTFNQRGRMSVATVSGSVTDYVYNALGQLIEKSGNGGTTLLIYDEAGHLVGEYSSTGALVQETVWMDDLPVATLRPSGSTACTSTPCIFYVHTDHIGTPRKVTESTSTNNLVWRWDPDTFGSVAPNSNPSGLGTFTYNLRFAGQYSLTESGLYYNYFRDYDPQTGRYVESDPIGLAGGNYSTYGYADENPVSFSDPMGLYVKLCSRWLGNPKSKATWRINPYRHDYLDVSGQFIGFYSAPGANPAWGQGVVAGQNEQDGGRCSSLCSDNKFDAYVLAAAQEIGAPTYCAIASAEFGIPGLAAVAAGAQNCQSWARDVIAKAKQNYLAHEKCPTCFKN
jgi:RHS repeat-associated protein